MKKIILFLFVLFVSIFDVNASSKFSLGEKEDIYIKVISDTNTYIRGPHILLRDDLEFVYCINPNKVISTTDYYNEYSYNDLRFNLSDEKLNKINLIAHFGYKYKNHTDIKWYSITQYLIWKEFDLKDIYFTDLNFNKINIYESEIRELENLVNNYYKLPSFANIKLEYSSNKSYKLIDTNNVFKDYELLNSDIDVEMSGNELTINTKNDGIYNVSFIKRSPINNDYKLYALDGAQELLYPGRINDIKFSITIEVNSGDIRINKIDSENKNRLEATLQGALYGIYNNNKLITTIETNSNGIAYIKDLPLGSYTVKEISPSLGYLIDSNVYKIDITKENKNFIINSYENVIKGNLIINKYYGEQNNYKLEDKAIFEIYDSNKNLVDILETKEGIINTKLPYGNYYIVQKEGIEGYKYVESFNVFINEEKNYEYNLYNEIIKGNLIINKYYGEENDYKLEDGAIFEIYDSNKTKVDVLETKEGIINTKLPYGNYTLKQIKGLKGYSYVDDINIFINEEKNYEMNLYDEKMLIVEVPDTGINEKKYNITSLILIIFGSLIIILSKRKKVTNC